MSTTDLTGQMLIAMPGMGDPRFSNSVVFMCAHSDEGAMGLIVNKPSSEIAMSDLWKQLSIPGKAIPGNPPVYYGGPVEQARGFVLHGTDYGNGSETLVVNDSFHMTATVDVLRDIGSGAGPAQFLMALGYAGWGPGQLEGEIAQNGWLTCDGSVELVFETSNSDKWAFALKTIGVTPMTLSAEGGRA